MGKTISDWFGNKPEHNWDIILDATEFSHRGGNQAGHMGFHVEILENVAQTIN